LGAQLVGRKGHSDYSGIIFPYIRPGEDRPCGQRLRLDRPQPEIARDGKTKEGPEYLVHSGCANMFYFPPGVTQHRLSAVTLPVIITEGEKKTLALWHLVNEGQKLPPFLPIGISDVWSWKGKLGSTKKQTGPIQDFELITWKDRISYTLFDSDKKRNANVLGAECALAAELKSHGSTIKIVDLPDLPGLDKIGVDDFLVHADGGSERLLVLI
jgi:hypothetical protein